MQNDSNRKKSHMEMWTNAHPECNGDPWGGVDIVDSNGHKTSRIWHWSGRAKHDELECIVRRYNILTGYGDYTG